MIIDSCSASELLTDRWMRWDGCEPRLLYTFPTDLTILISDSIPSKLRIPIESSTSRSRLFNWWQSICFKWFKRIRSCLARPYSSSSSLQDMATKQVACFPQFVITTDVSRIGWISTHPYSDLTDSIYKSWISPHLIVVTVQINVCKPAL